MPLNICLILNDKKNSFQGGVLNLSRREKQQRLAEVANEATTEEDERSPLLRDRRSIN